MPDVSILVVEDEPAVAEVVSLYLHRAGYRVRVANTGQAALREIDHQPPALIILDLMLPGLDGWAITRTVRGRGDTPGGTPRRSLRCLADRCRRLAVGCGPQLDRRSHLRHNREFFRDGAAADGTVGR